MRAVAYWTTTHSKRLVRPDADAVAGGHAQGQQPRAAGGGQLPELAGRWPGSSASRRRAPRGRPMALDAWRAGCRRWFGRAGASGWRRGRRREKGRRRPCRTWRAPPVFVGRFGPGPNGGILQLVLACASSFVRRPNTSWDETDLPWTLAAGGGDHGRPRQGVGAGALSPAGPNALSPPPASSAPPGPFQAPARGRASVPEVMEGQPAQERGRFVRVFRRT